MTVYFAGSLYLPKSKHKLWYFVCKGRDCHDDWHPATETWHSV